MIHHSFVKKKKKKWTGKACHMENYKYLENLKCQGQKWLSISRDRGQRSLSICQIVFSGSSLDRSHTELKTQSMQSVHRSNRDGLSYMHFCHSCPLIYVNFLTNERIFSHIFKDIYLAKYACTWKQWLISSINFFMSHIAEQSQFYLTPYWWRQMQFFMAQKYIDDE